MTKFFNPNARALRFGTLYVGPGETIDLDLGSTDDNVRQMASHLVVVDNRSEKVIKADKKKNAKIILPYTPENI